MSGFVAKVDSISKKNKFDKPPARLAVVFNTFYPEFKGGFFLDHELILSLLKDVVGTSVVQIEIDGLVLNNVDKLGLYWEEGWQKDDKHDPSENSIFALIEVLQGESLMYQIFGKDWHRIGGPDPYHDSITVEFFCNRNDFGALLNQVRKSLKKSDCRIQEVRGLELPQIPWWKKLVHRMRG